ncbi:MAG TPA: ABC transporter permease [Ruminococcaceae bacterium]|nr:ABC transporter permease [Oscillospiraceae bacterium]
MNSVVATIFSANFLFSVIRLTTPILLAALAALITDRAGVMNIGLEGIMLCSALTGVVGSAATHNAFLGLMFAILTGVVLGLIMAYSALNLKADIILVGIAVNLMASGGTIFVLYSICGDKGNSTSLKSLTMPSVSLPLIKDIPVLGSILSGHNLLTYLAFLCVFLIWLLLYKTPLGLRIRVVGENPNAAESVGINVRKVQYIVLVISGILAAVGGAYMSMGYMDKFSRDMVAGRGFIALAAEALGTGTPAGIMGSSLIFGAADALATNLQVLDIPVQFVQMIPYALTIVGLIIYSVSRIRKEKKIGISK